MSDTEPTALAPRSAGELAIKVSRLRKIYRDAVAVDDASFNVRNGEIFWVIGPNGAAKTTTVECVGSLRVPDNGYLSQPRRPASSNQV